MMAGHDDLIRKIRRKLHWLRKTKKYTILDGVPKEQLDAIFRNEDMKLPDELRIWLELCNGIVATQKNTSIVFGQIYGVDRNPRLGLNMFWCMTEFSLWKLNGWIPIADDGCGNIYGLIPHGMNNKKEWRVAYFEASGSTEKSYDTPVYISCYDCFSFMNLLLLAECLACRNSRLRVFARFFEGGVEVSSKQPD